MQDNMKHGVLLKVRILQGKPVFKWAFSFGEEKSDEIVLPDNVYPNICHYVFQLTHIVNNEKYSLLYNDNGEKVSLTKESNDIEEKDYKSDCKSDILKGIYEKLKSEVENKTKKDNKVDLRDAEILFIKEFKRLERDKNEKYKKLGKNDERIIECIPSKAYYHRTVFGPRLSGEVTNYQPVKYYTAHLNDKNKPRRCY